MWSEKKTQQGYSWDVVWDIILEIIWDRLWDIIWDALATKCVGLVCEWEMIRQIWPCHVHRVFVGPFVAHDPRDPLIPQNSPSGFRESSDLFGLLPQLKGLFLDGGLCFLLHMIDIELLLKLQQMARLDLSGGGRGGHDKIISSCPIVTYLTLFCLISSILLFSSILISTVLVL